MMATETIEAPVLPDSGRIFRKMDWAAFWTVFIISLGVYAYTLAPTVTLEYSGELVVAADFLGVPHTSGYPVWTLLAWFFQWVFHFVTYHGHPNPAWGAAFLSSVSGAGVCAMLALLVSHSGEEMIRPLLKRDNEAMCFVAAVSAGLLLAFSPVFWSQCVIADVHSLNALFQMAVLFMVYLWICRPKDAKWFCLAAFLFGLGMANHQTMFFLLILLAPLSLCLLKRRQGGVFIFSILLIAIGMSTYFYLPIASEQNPPMNWGYPRTWAGFVHVINRGQYDSIAPTDIFSEKFIHQLGAYLAGLRSQFTLPIALLGGLPFCAWSIRAGRRRLSVFPGALALVLAAGFFMVLETVSGGTWAAWIYRPLMAAEFLLVLLGVFILLVLWIRKLFNRPLPHPPGKFDFDLPISQQHWLLASIMAFVATSVVLLIVINPTLDIQNLFLARVQFIPGYSFYALWIGYGVLLSIAHLAKRSHVWAGGGSVVALLLPAVLLWQNAYDEDQIRIIGGAEQRGHDFGWQFGNWSLQGVNGIEEDLRYELSPEEFERVWAEYPTPGYPPPMSSNAIFYGGTDPGRFVPTYMIYSAEVCRDVYLITQNALADNTFMNVTRDLYGDTIFIPSDADSDEAFRRYIGDVQAGRITDAGVKIQDGRVSVQGVQGVMAINGALAKLIFEANKFRHDFYVEESYPIQWMYPYLTPHGLIMKINKEPLGMIPEENIENDRKFWTWYCDFLLTNSRFTRDICARKSFSKLRSAIAGLYHWRGNIPEAELAYKQAIDLYPLSPEAVLHLGQIYVNTGRMDAAEELVQEFLRQDPNSDAGKNFMSYLEKNKQMRKRRAELEQF